MQVARINAETAAPHNVEAEQQLLGALMSNNDLFTQTVDLIDADAFYDDVHREIFELIAKRVDAGQLASPITLRAAFVNHSGLRDLGGPSYLVRLVGSAVSTFAIRDYCQVIADLAAKRSMLAAMVIATDLIAEGAEGASAIASDLETSAGAIMSRTSVKPLIQTYASAVTAAVEASNAAYMGDIPPGVSSGLPQLDKVLGRFRRGQMILLAGRPSMGKTTVAQNLAFSAAMNGVGVFFGSLEMLGEELGSRFISKGLAASGTAKIPYNRIIAGRLSEGEMRHVIEEGRRQLELPMLIGERDIREVRKFRSAVKRAQQRLADTDTPLGLVIVDYVQKMEVKGARGQYEAVSAASDLCKDLAMDLGLPVIALAQLSRNVELRDPPVPMLSDIRESGKLEEDADVVLFCYRDAYYLQRKLDALDGRNAEEEADIRATLERCQHNVDIIVSKQRSGATGTVGAFMLPAYCHVTADLSEHGGHLI